MGAPEALVIGVVALLVFGPKGLAEIAKQLGSTLRAFQPTIRELQDVSREFKETLEDEIGLDDIRNPTPTPRQAPPAQTEAPAEPVAAPAEAAPAEAAPAEAAPAAPAEVPADLAAEEGEAPPKA